MDKLIWIYLAAVNIAAYILCGWDKTAAKARARRIPEKVLFFISIIGGSAGMLGGMTIFRHKTRKPAFYIGIPLIIILQISAVYFFFR